MSLRELPSHDAQDKGQGDDGGRTAETILSVRFCFSRSPAAFRESFQYMAQCEPQCYIMYIRYSRDIRQHREKRSS